MRQAWLALVVIVCGCTSDPADTGGDLQFLRDPASGMCLPLPMPMPDEGGGAKDTPYASWAPCEDPCAGLDEGECRADPRCKPRFEGTMCPPNAACLPAQYAGCDPVPQVDKCLGLDQPTCSKTPGCEPIYGGKDCMCADGSMACACPAIAEYRGCHQVVVVVACTGNEQCGPGQHCTTRDGVCGPPPGCDKGEVCPAVCGGVCVPDDVMPPFPGCGSDADCGKGERCLRKEAPCDASGACPGSAGVCVPDGPRSCFELGDERTCIARADCEPVYIGSTCSCAPDGCSCKDYTFTSCRPRPAPPPMCEGVAGTWSAGIRTYVLDKSGTFTVSDAVAPCPPEGVCVWSGIIVNRGKWSLDAGGLIALVYAEPVQKWDGLKLATQLALKGCDYLVELDSGKAFERKK